MPLKPGLRLLLLAAGLALAACGGGAEGAGAAAAATPLGTAATATPTAVAPTAANAVASPEALPTLAAPEPSARAPLSAPSLPRAGLEAADMAVLIKAGDPLSEAIGLAYQRARGIPEAHMIRVELAGDGDAISAADFAAFKTVLDARLPATAQATLVTWQRPSRVQGSCSMGLTSALALGYDPPHCGGCSRTLASTYYDSDSSRPFSDLGLRPSMMLGSPSLAAAQALIARGLAADGSAPAGTGYLLRTSDTARSVRYPDFAALPAAWADPPGLVLRYLDASAPGSAQSLSGVNDLLFYFTGSAKVAGLASNQFLPGAAADHLTSFAGQLPGASGQMPATDWLAAGATASYGTVEEPCNHLEKFPRASVLIEHYLRGATLIEAYWKSVAWPGQGLFVGDPLARPWNQAPSAQIEGDALVLRSRSLRRNATYRLEYRPYGGTAWALLGSMTAGQPGPITWRVPLPADTAGGHLRWVGPCATQPGQRCVLAQSV